MKRITAILLAVLMLAVPLRVSAAKGLLKEKKVAVAVGEYRELGVTESGVSLTVSDPEIARVNRYGIVCGKALGKTSVLAEGKNGVTDRCTVLVSRQDRYVFIGNSRPFPTVNGKRYRSWKSKSRRVMNRNGRLKALKEGRAVFKKKVGGVTYTLQAYGVDKDKMYRKAVKTLVANADPAIKTYRIKNVYYGFIGCYPAFYIHFTYRDKSGNRYTDNFIYRAEYHTGECGFLYYGFFTDEDCTFICKKPYRFK